MNRPAAGALELVKGDANPKYLELTEPITLGREPGVDLRVQDPAVSRQHARLGPTPDGGSWQIRDLGSSNGTFVNGRQVAQARLSHGDRIEFGDTVLRFVDLEGARKKTAAHQRSRSRALGADPGVAPHADLADQVLIGSSDAMQGVRDQIEKVGPSEATVLILGETGTGKELVSRALHRSGARASGPFVAVNCAAVTSNLVESELFGHEKGAFTGASQRQKGRFERAHGGTLFLDEVAEMPLETQSKLLRALETRTIERVGGSKSIDVDVRFVAATNRDLSRRMADGEFRRDLFYRLCVVSIEVPPLRDHRDDIPELIDHFLAPNEGVSLQPDVIPVLRTHSWPGNVRELRNVVEGLALMAGGEPISADQVRRAIIPAAVEDTAELAGPGPSLREAEEYSIRRALQATGWNKSAAARLLGIARPTLHKKIRRYGITQD